MATAFLMMPLTRVAAHLRRNPITNRVPANGFKLNHGVHGKRRTEVLFHDPFITITNNWMGLDYRLVKTRKVIAVELQGRSPISIKMMRTTQGGRYGTEC